MAESDSSLVKLSPFPERKSDKGAKNGDDMMDILVDDIIRYETLAEREEIYALTSALAGDGDSEVVFEEIVIQPTAGHNKENTRFKPISIAETEQFIEDNKNKNTIYKTKSDLKLFSEYCTANGELRKVEDIPGNELDSLLARFYLGVRKRDGNEYEPDTLSGVQNSIDRHLRDKKIPLDIKKDNMFAHSRKVLESKRKELKGQGKGNKKLKADSVDAEDMKMLYDKKLLGAANPNSLLNTVWLNNGVFFGFRGRQEHASLLLGDLELKKDASGTEYVEFYERATKTRSGAKSGDQRAVPPKMFAKDSPYCPVKMFKTYLAKRPVDMREDSSSRFYLRPLEKPTDEVWYSHQPLGKNKLGLMMKNMATEASISGRKVNHSTRKTFASTLLQSDRPNTEVAQLGGWKSVSTLTNYNVPSTKQQNKASNILSEIMIPEISNEKLETEIVADCSEEPVVDEPATESFKDLTESQPIITNSTNTNSNMIANRKETNPFSILCGASISGGVINLNIYSGKRKHFECESSQE